MAKRKPFVLAVVGSARRGGNCDILCNRAIAGAEAAGARVEKVYLSDFPIRTCAACETCTRQKSRRCAHDDGMRALYPLLEKADALLLATPVYFFNMSAAMKLFIDKWFPLTEPNRLRLNARRAGICVTYGAPDPLQAGCDNVKRTFSDIFAYAGIPMRMVHTSAWRKGDVRKRAAALKDAYEMGKELIQRR